ncbi:MAG: hypothetical protein GKS05_13100 [Nitrospirales bacterium]|nr:hypothetical protein [Nitrospirales bacterium]
MATTTKPVHTLQSGNMTAAVWENRGEKGVFFSTTFSRSFQDPAGSWHRSHSFGAHDLEALMNLALDAKQWITTHAIGV